MSKLTIAVVAVMAAVGISVLVVPALRGPYNRFRNEVNEKLDAEYVVDNYKAEYVALHEKRAEVTKAISKFGIDRKVAEKKLADARIKAETAKKVLKETGSADLKAFSRAKDIYETLLAAVSNLEIEVKTYSQAMAKLDSSLALINANMARAKLNVDTLSSKKALLDTIKTVNKSIENMNGIGDSTLAVNVEKLDDDMLRESIRLEALNTGNSPKAEAVTQESAKAYLDALK